MKKRVISLMLILVMTASLLAGCGNKNQGNSKEDDRIEITMYMWDRAMFKELSP